MSVTDQDSLVWRRSHSNFNCVHITNHRHLLGAPPTPRHRTLCTVHIYCIYTYNYAQHNVITITTSDKHMWSLAWGPSPFKWYAGEGQTESLLGFLQATETMLVRMGLMYLHCKWQSLWDALGIVSWVPWLKNTKITTCGWAGSNEYRRCQWTTVWTPHR